MVALERTPDSDADAYGLRVTKGKHKSHLQKENFNFKIHSRKYVSVQL